MAQESDLEKRISRMARDHGCYTRKFVAPGHAGVPDRLIIRQGLTLFLEIKAPGKKPTDLQKDEINLINASGGFATWCADIDTAILLIAAMVRGDSRQLRSLCREFNYWMP